MLRTRVITALILLIVLLAVIFSKSFLIFSIVASVFFFAAMWESFRLFGGKYPIVGAGIWTAAFIFVIVGDRLPDRKFFFGLCIAIWLLRIVPSLAIGLPALDGPGNRLLNAIYGIAILGCFIAIAELFKYSPLYLFSIMSIVWIADIGAYFAGKAWGKRKLAPTISPGKSWEGAVGGLAAVLILCAVTINFPVLNDTFQAKLFSRWGWLGFTLILALLAAASVVGDLFESQLKRRAKMKDSSNLLPGHGGVLDRIDALIPTLPLAAFVHTWL